MIGIYKITNPKGKVYIGQSIDILNRWQYYERYGCKGQPKLHSSFTKYGLSNHTFEIIEECLEAELNLRERYWQEQYNVLQEGLNLRLTLTEDRSGRLSEELKSRISKKLTGRKIPRDVVEKWMKDKVPYERTEEIRLKCSLSKKGKPLTEEHKAKLREAKRKKLFN
jgi:group I intron endonuclease